MEDGMPGKRIVQIGILLIGLVALGLTAVRAEEKDIVARVGQKVITKAEFEQLLKKKGGEPAKDKQMEMGLLNNMVQTLALGEAARKKGIDKRKDIQAILELTVDNVLANELIKEEVISKLKVTEGQAREYYDKNSALFKTPEQIKALHILIKVDKSASADDKKKAREKAEGILKRIRAGEDFAKLAMEFSDDPGSKARGGDLGLFGRGRMVKPFEEAAFNLKPGTVSEVVETAFGYHLIKVETKQKEEVPPFETVKDKAREKATEEIRGEKIKEFLKQVMKEADIKIFAEVLEGQKK
jgi:peptidyl-prolyl cis-trans isomerase C